MPQKPKTHLVMNTRTIRFWTTAPSDNQVRPLLESHLEALKTSVL